MDGQEPKQKEKLAGVLFVAGVGLCSAIGGFSWTLAGVQRLDAKTSHPNEILNNAALAKSRAAHQLHVEGVQLATRALAWGSLWAITGCSLFVLGVWTLSGAKNFQDFRTKVGTVLPKLSRRTEGGINDFKDLEDFLQYVSGKKEDK